MKYLNILYRVAPILICAIGTISTAEAQNTVQLIQAEKEQEPSVSVQIIKSPMGDRQHVKSKSVRYITMEKSDKMVIVNTKLIDSIPKVAPSHKTRVIRKMKSEKIDQK